MRKFPASTRGAIMGLVFALMSSTNPAAQTADDVTISMHKLTDNLYMLSGAGGNVSTLIGDDGTLLVDCGVTVANKKLSEAIESIGGNPAAKYLLNTHYHFDHTGGNELLKKSGAINVAHHNVRELLAAGQTISFLERTNPPLPESWLPQITFEKEISLHLNGEDVDFVHFGPAHTGGDGVVHFRNANVIQVGDIFFHTVYPFIDVENGASVDGLIAAIDSILARTDEDTRIIPGHGPLATYAEFKAYRDMLVTIADRVRQLAKEGKSYDEIVAAKPTAEYDTANQGAFTAENLIQFIYDYVSK